MDRVVPPVKRREVGTSKHRAGARAWDLLAAPPASGAGAEGKKRCRVGAGPRTPASASASGGGGLTQACLHPSPAQECRQFPGGHPIAYPGGLEGVRDLPVGAVCRVGGPRGIDGPVVDAGALRHRHTPSLANVIQHHSCGVQAGLDSGQGLSQPQGPRTGTSQPQGPGTGSSASLRGPGQHLSQPQGPGTGSSASLRGLGQGLSQPQGPGTAPQPASGAQDRDQPASGARDRILSQPQGPGTAPQSASGARDRILSQPQGPGTGPQPASGARDSASASLRGPGRGPASLRGSEHLGLGSS
ncbi:hypothetical protein P7K49_040210 [Saguinus oedipus]|uniref:Uncharacterized protein n=1 Tax=Saguinus oedipus TaxID=9490 RepID=A0ABQ9T8L3_SAGOE|nr:hypothetical protein P7K49_040210 [Saguinus oedipus]